MAGEPGFIRRHRAGLLFGALLVGLVIYQLPALRSLGYGGEPPETFAWRTGFDAGLAEARAEGKLVLLNFTADWCRPCRVMRHEVWPEDEVRSIVEARFVPIILDIDVPANGPIAYRYGISSIPAIMIVNDQGEVLHRGQAMSARQMARFLTQAVADR